MVEEPRAKIEEQACAGPADQPVLEESHEAQGPEQHQEREDDPVQLGGVAIKECGIDDPARHLRGGQTDPAADEHHQRRAEQAGQVTACEPEQAPCVDGRRCAAGWILFGHRSSPARVARILARVPGAATSILRGASNTPNRGRLGQSGPDPPVDIEFTKPRVAAGPG